MDRIIKKIMHVCVCMEIQGSIWCEIMNHIIKFRIIYIRIFLVSVVYILFDFVCIKLNNTIYCEILTNYANKENGWRNISEIMTN